MKILIVEGESYLASSLASKLECEHCTCDIKSPAHAMSASGYDVVLLSMGGFFDHIKLIKTHAKSVVILLINYISNDIIEAMKAGADDYIIKPIIIEELRRKILLFSEFKHLKTLNQSYESIFKDNLNSVSKDPSFLKKIRFPLCLISNECIKSDLFVYALVLAKNLSFARLGEPISDTMAEQIEYFYNYDSLSIEQKHQILNKSESKIIIRSKTSQNLSNEIFLDEKGCGTQIMALDEYIKFCINTYQDNYSDVELANMLGISRKSLWEKRRKYEITKRR